jgi:hypothetical protein
VSDLQLLRVGGDSSCTQGVLRHKGLVFAVTLELPWLDNQPTHSCIPLGTYTCRRVQSPHFGETFEITGVEGRNHVLFHKGNTTVDTKGCVLIGESYNDLSIGDSKGGYGEFMRKFKDQPAFTLDILHAQS